MVDTACVFAAVPEHAGVIFHCAEHHFRVLCKIGIDRNTVLRPAKMHPVRLRHDFALPFLKEDNVACDISSRTVLKCGTGETDCPKKFRPFCNVFPY